VGDDTTQPARTTAPRRVRDVVRRVQWPAVVAAAAVALVLGYVGFARYFEAAGEQPTFWDILYRDLQLFTIESGSVIGSVPWQLQVARFLAPAVTMVTAVAAVTALLSERLSLARLRFWSDHTVICGLGRKGLFVAEELTRRSERVVVIENDELNDHIERLRQRGVTVLLGDASDPQLLRRARAGRARRALAVCGDDAINAEVALRCRELSRESGGSALDCYVHIVDGDLCRLLKEQELRGSGEDLLRLEFFNVFESGAGVLVRQYPPFSPEAAAAAGPAPHVLVVGCGNMGSNVVARCAREWWRAGLGRERRLTVSVVDREANARCAAIEARWPRLVESCDLVRVPIDVTSAAFERGDFLDGGPERRSPVSIAYVCLDDDSRGLSAALAVHRRARQRAVPVVVRMSYDTGLAGLVAGAGGFEGLSGFAVISWVCEPDRLFAGTHETIARAMHRSYVAEQLARGETESTNPATAPWEHLPDEFRESNRRQADQAVVRLAAVGCDITPLSDWEAEWFTFTEREVDEMARFEHERWCDERRAAQWTFSAGVKDVKRRTNPLLVAWDDLPEAVKEENRVTVRELPHFLADVGLQVVRLSTLDVGSVDATP
jgi:hypothetical protein